MSRLLYFLYKYRDFTVFVLLESMSIFFIIHEDLYKASTSHVIGSIHGFVNEIKNYPLLQEENEQLLHENAVLMGQLLQAKAPVTPSYSAAYHCIPARVINNSIVGTKNHLTLNKGAMHGIAPGMGVVSTEGIVGRVKAVSNHFATVISLLHTGLQVSAQIVNEESMILGTVQWSGHDPCRARMRYVPRHVSVELGNKVVTSGYNATFFEGALIGYVHQVKRRKEAHFYEIELHLSTDFSTLQHVYVVDNTLKREKDALEKRTQDFYE